MRWSVTREENDRLVDSRISIGTKKGVGGYLVFRGDPDKVITALEEAVIVARKMIAEGNYRDKRGRPQG